jgi:hypothetical protein
LKASGWDQATIDRKVAIELNNGIAAQMRILALIVNEKLDNNPYVLKSLLVYQFHLTTIRTNFLFFLLMNFFTDSRNFICIFKFSDTCF